MLDTTQTQFDPDLEICAPREQAQFPRPSRDVAEEAVRTLIRWAGDDPRREGLTQTPARVVRAFEEWFAGYKQQTEEILARTFGEVGGYEDAVLLRRPRLAGGRGAGR